MMVDMGEIPHTMSETRCCANSYTPWDQLSGLKAQLVLTKSLALLLQVLRQKHQLSEPDMQRLYRVLHIYSLGFHQIVADITSKATAQQQLLPAIWKAFLQLWEEALEVRSFRRATIVLFLGSQVEPVLANPGTQGMRLVFWHLGFCTSSASTTMLSGSETGELRPASQAKNLGWQRHSR